MEVIKPKKEYIFFIKSHIIFLKKVKKEMIIMVVSYQMGFAKKYLERIREDKFGVETVKKPEPKFKAMVKISSAPKTEASEKYPVDHKKLHEKLGWSIPNERVDKILKRDNGGDFV